jgi:hypothetical protein
MKNAVVRDKAYPMDGDGHPDPVYGVLILSTGTG